MRLSKGFVMMESLVALLLVGIALVPLSLGVGNSLLKKSPQKFFEANRVLEYEMQVRFPMDDWGDIKEISRADKVYSHWWIEFREEKQQGLRCLIGSIKQVKATSVIASLRRCKPR